MVIVILLTGLLLYQSLTYLPDIIELVVSLSYLGLPFFLLGGYVALRTTWAFLYLWTCIKPLYWGTWILTIEYGLFKLFFKPVCGLPQVDSSACSNIDAFNDICVQPIIAPAVCAPIDYSQTDNWMFFFAASVCNIAIMVFGYLFAHTATYKDLSAKHTYISLQRQQLAKDIADQFKR